MRNLAILAALGVMASPSLVDAAQPVSSESVNAIREMAIAAGQTSSSRTQETTPGQDAMNAERESIERHRQAFVARTYSSPEAMAATHEPEDTTTRPLSKGWQPTRIGQATLSTPKTVSQAVSREMVAAIRQLAIEAGQVSSTPKQTPELSKPARESRRNAIEGSRAEFFARAYGNKPAM